MPDLAGAHYSDETVVWMEENVHFVEKVSNSPDVEGLDSKPIENLWGILTQKVYEGGWQTRT